MVVDFADPFYLFPSFFQRGIIKYQCPDLSCIVPYAIGKI